MAGFLLRKRALRRAVDRKGSRLLRVFSLSDVSAKGVLRSGNLSFQVAAGRSGVRFLKREGDGATPGGVWRIREIFYRADRIQRPVSSVPLKPIRRHDGWCDAASDRNYNRKVRLPYPASSESLWRQDHLYDIVAVLDYNELPRIKGRGSAIFLHVARSGLAPTEGCIAMRHADLLRLIAQIPRGSAVIAGKSVRLPQRGRRGLR